MLEDKNIRSALRTVLDSAADQGFLSAEQGAFTEMLFDRIDREIEQKTKEHIRLDGQIKQLTLTKQLVINMIKDSIKAAERAKAREETYARMKEGKAARETVVVEEDKPAKKTTTKKTTTKKSTAKKSTEDKPKTARRRKKKDE